MVSTAEITRKQLLTEDVDERENHRDHLEREAEQESYRHNLQDNLPV